MRQRTQHDSVYWKRVAESWKPVRAKTIGQRLFRATVIAAILWPWGVSVVFKLCYDVLGWPTYPWISFLTPDVIVLELVFSSIFALPLILFACISRWLLDTSSFPGLQQKERLWLVMAGLTAGYAAMAWSAWRIFDGFEDGYDILYFLFPRYYPAIGIGVLLGGVAVLVRRCVKR